MIISTVDPFLRLYVCIRNISTYGALVVEHHINVDIHGREIYTKGQRTPLCIGRYIIRADSLIIIA